MNPSSDQKKVMVGPIISMEENKEMGDTSTPKWLKPLIEANYFNQCKDHANGDFNKSSECKYFCLDCCMDESVCSYCLIHHKQHRILQIRRSSYHNVIKVDEVEKYIDVSGVQHYVSNASKIVFLKQRPQYRPGVGLGAGSATCEICARVLLDSFRFCSLGCKLEGLKSGDPELTFSVGIKLKSTRDKIHKSDVRVSSDGDIGVNLSPDTPVNSYRTRRRKGIPRRAPFF